MSDLPTTGFDFPDIVDEAVFRSGGMTATAQDVVNVRRSLKLLLERWNNEGFNTWRFKTKTFLISPEATHVTLPANVDDVINVNSITLSSSESPMRRIGVDEYSKLTTKLTKGQPSMFFLSREACPKLFYYPVGREAISEQLIVTYMERPAAFDRTSNEVDAPGRWLEALILGLALDLARKRPPYDEPTIQRLTVESGAAEDLAQRADRQKHNFRVRMGRRR